MSTLVLVPSRGRPDSARELERTFLDTKRDARSGIVFIVDDDDPTLSQYPPHATHVVAATGCMNAALVAATPWALRQHHDVFGFLGDDHRFRTEGWDVDFEAVLEANGGGVAFCDDLYQRQNLPTMWFLSRNIVEVFGMGLPTLRHLWIDNYWKEMGEGGDCLYYFPQHVIEHMHPYAGKGVMDAGYERVNSGEMINHDRAAFMEWQANLKSRDLATLRSLIVP